MVRVEGGEGGEVEGVKNARDVGGGHIYVK